MEQVHHLCPQCFAIDHVLLLLTLSLTGAGAFGAAPGSTKRRSATVNTVETRGVFLGGE